MKWKVRLVLSLFWLLRSREVDNVSLSSFLYVCLSVYLSVCWRISNPTRPNFTKFSLHVTCGRGLVSSDGSAISYDFGALKLNHKNASRVQELLALWLNCRSSVHGPTQEMLDPGARRRRVLGEAWSAINSTPVHSCESKTVCRPAAIPRDPCHPFATQRSVSERLR